MSRLESCLSCGGTASVYRPKFTYFERYGVECLECGLRTREYPTMAEAVESWNTRPARERLIERIEDIRNNTPNADFKNGCNACLAELAGEV